MICGVAFTTVKVMCWYLITLPVRGIERAFSNIEGARQEMFTLANGRTLNVEEMLIGHAMNDPDDPVYPGLGLTKEPSRKDLERAYFAYRAKLGAAEIERRLRGQ